MAAAGRWPIVFAFATLASACSLTLASDRELSGGDGADATAPTADTGAIETGAIETGATNDGSGPDSSNDSGEGTDAGGDATDAGTSYAGVVLSDGPVGYWRLGELAGTTASDSSGNGRNGTYVLACALGQPGALL